MKHTLKINSEEVRARAVVILQSLPLDPVHELRIDEFKRNRSAEQHRTLWMWYTVIASELGDSKESIHEIMKGKFLCNIYERDNKEYSEMLQTIRSVYREGMRDEALDLHKKIISLTSTTTASVKQMSEYMEAISHHAASLGIKLPYPED